MVNSLSNVYVCTCLPIARGDMQAAVRRLDPDKIMFGCDVPDLPVRSGFGPILYARFADDVKRKIMSLNAQRLLEQVAPNVRRSG